MMSNRTKQLLGVFLLSGWVCASHAVTVDKAFVQAAEQHRVPPKLFFAIALQESGWSVDGRYQPWPWTLTIDKKPHRFKTREAAYGALRAALEQERQVGVGVLQIEWDYHADKFGSAWDALDPARNRAVGAGILRGYYDRLGDWWRAVGRYHTRDSQRGLAYRLRVQARLETLR